MKQAKPPISTETKNRFQTKDEIRNSVNEQRKRLTDKEIMNSGLAVKEIAFSNPALYKILSNAKRILSYFPFNGEMPPQYLTEHLNAKIFLPKITDYHKKQMQFFSDEQRQIKNRYGIFEPIGTGEPIELSEFDLILMPLIAFDNQGNRIGMGAGFYDRAFAGIAIRPLLIGLAYDFQKKSIPAEAWDVPIDVIITNQKIIDPANSILN